MTHSKITETMLQKMRKDKRNKVKEIRAKNNDIAGNLAHVHTWLVQRRRLKSWISLDLEHLESLFS